MERRAQGRVSLDVSNRFWQPQRRLWSLQIARSRDVFCPPFPEPGPIGKAKQDARQELLVEALKPLEGRCSQRPDAPQKIIWLALAKPRELEATVSISAYAPKEQEDRARAF
jgi:hypothetical protein